MIQVTDTDGDIVEHDADSATTTTAQHLQLSKGDQFVALYAAGKWVCAIELPGDKSADS